MDIYTPVEQKRYCCLQFSLFSLGFGRPDLSVCRFVGGTKVGSSGKSCGCTGSVWPFNPEGEMRSTFSTCLKGWILRAPFPVYSTCPLTAPLCAQPPGLEGRVELLGDVSDVLALSVKAAAGSQHWEAVETVRFVCSDSYSVAEVGLGGWFSGEQSSMGEGRPSESSLSRWTCGGGSRVWINITTTQREEDITAALLQHTCLSLDARLSWLLIMALCSRHDDGPSNSRDRRFDFISSFCIKWAIS